MIETILATIISFLIGYILSKVLADKKITELITKIDELTKSIDILNAKYENIEQIRYNTYDIEKRIAELEAEIKLIRINYGN